MEKNKAQMFNQKAASDKSQAEEVINSLEIKEGNVIADIGSGGGFFAFKIADRVGENGKVICIDNSKDLLNYIESKENSRIKTILYDGKNLMQEKNSLDLIFMRNVTHHIKNREKYFKGLYDFLKSDGRIVVIDYKKGSIFTFHGLFGHFVHQKVIVKEMQKAGYKILKKFDFLMHQHFTIFKKA